MDVTYANLISITKEIDPLGKGLHPNTIRTNSEAHAYYAKHSTTYKRYLGDKDRRRGSQTSPTAFHFEDIKLERDKKSVINRFIKMSKADLAERLFAAEQYIAANREKWLMSQFIDFEMNSESWKKSK